MKNRALVSRDPATLEKVGEVRAASPSDVRRAVERARAAQRAWAGRGANERAAIVARAADLMAARKEDLARLVTREMGKPITEARTEVENTIGRLRYFAEKGPEALAPREEDAEGVVGIVEHRPRGVVAAIQPWNFPVNIPVWSISPALIAGNAVVFKPSELVPLTGAALAAVFHDAGVPGDVLVVVQGADATGAALVESDVEMIAFVGSQAVGRKIAEAAAPAFKKIALEMGGKDPAVVLADCDVEQTAEGIVRGAFKNCGQVCCSIERVYAERPVFRRLVDAVVDRAARLRIGHGLDEGVQVGPMVREAERRRVEAMVRDARRRGAKVLCGGGRPDVGLPGWFFAPTVLTEVPDSAEMNRREIFGPALPILEVRDADEAIARANALPFGLTATVWTGDPARGAEVARRIEAGTVAVNRTTGSIVQHPWGGVKSSGVGRMLGLEGIREFAEVVTIRLPAGCRTGLSNRLVTWKPRRSAPTRPRRASRASSRRSGAAGRSRSRAGGSASPSCGRFRPRRARSMAGTRGASGSPMTFARRRRSSTSTCVDPPRYARVALV